MATIQRAPLVPRLSPAPQQLSPLSCFPGALPRMIAGLKFNGFMPGMLPMAANLNGHYPPAAHTGNHHTGPRPGLVPHPMPVPVSPGSQSQRGTIPISPIPLPPPHPANNMHHMPIGLHPEMVPRFLPPLPIPTFTFSQSDLDMTLYGYAKRPDGDTSAGHALSGLRVGHLNHGIDKILGNSSPVKSYSPKPQPLPRVDPSTLDLPEGVELQQTIFAGALHYGIFCKKTVVPKGTRFGPFRGKQVNTSEIKTNDDNSHMWEIFQDGRLSHFVDGRGCSGNWMAYVNCARYAQEQNLIAIQNDDGIFYEACKDIPQGTELLVWYGESYLQFMGIPVSLKDGGEPHNEEEADGEGYQCERCGKVFAYKYYRDKHLKYTRCVDQGDRKFPCHLCTRSFEKRDRLRIHILHVHEKHRPHKCVVCAKSFSQSSSLNKHMRVHSGERPYKCVYCNKAFTASSILRTHIRQHSGEKPFKCKHCGKAFASHAAHDSHVRRTHARDRASNCHVCGQTFTSTFDLKMHMATHNGVGMPGSTVAPPQPFPNFNEEPLDVVGLENDESSRVI